MCTTSDAMQAVVDTVNRYRVVLNDLRTGLDKNRACSPELKGREALLTWVAYCLVFQGTRDMYRRICAFGVCLRYEDLRHLVLGSRRQFKVLHLVKTFLQNHCITNCELFSGRNPQSTFTVGTTISRAHLKDIYDAEVKDAKVREEAFWAEVIRRKANVLRLENELVQLRQEERALFRRLIMPVDCSKHLTVSATVYTGRRRGNNYTKLNHYFRGKDRLLLGRKPTLKRQKSHRPRFTSLYRRIPL